ncbi:hypothetical protein MTR_7g024770 [Medicago truncatula]|uniref:Retrotransposon Copia-like N-terminal domain-containing protein n=1 Tax=Medicago truncatula TaxID=3880 RepID=G7KXV3_MEDTR|nr:hypothetical protein MTR_7g024770 [Medicago truncatula]
MFPIDPTSIPFYVYPSENPTASLVNPFFDGRIYHSWSRSLKKAIIMKNKL